MVLLGAGWNLALISGSLLLTTGVPARARPRREGWGEVSMGLAAAAAASAAGPVVAGGGYATLAVAGALTAAALLVAARPQRRTSARIGRRAAHRRGGRLGEVGHDEC
jgi:hypothetical protein